MTDARYAHLCNTLDWLSVAQLQARIRESNLKLSKATAAEVPNRLIYLQKLRDELSNR